MIDAMQESFQNYCLGVDDREEYGEYGYKVKT